MLTSIMVAKVFCNTSRQQQTVAGQLPLRHTAPPRQIFPSLLPTCEFHCEKTATGVGAIFKGHLSSHAAFIVM